MMMFELWLSPNGIYRVSQNFQRHDIWIAPWQKPSNFLAMRNGRESHELDEEACFMATGIKFFTKR